MTEYAGNQMMSQKITIAISNSFYDVHLRSHRPNGDKNSITLSEYHDFMGVGIFFLTIIVLKKKPPSHRNNGIIRM